MSKSIVETYVDAAIEQLRRLDMIGSPVVPDAMRDGERKAASDWIRWKPIASTVTEADLHELEKDAGLPFPAIYREFLSYLHFIDLTETGVRFERHLPGQWDKHLRNTYLHCRNRIMDVGLLPFGYESEMDAGPVCFDTRQSAPDGNYPVVFWDHESVGSENEVQPMFSSAAKMFECLTFVASNDIGFIRHFDDDAPELLPEKQSLLSEFLSLDPKGAGGPALDYWTCWGVKPLS